jgi:serine/threonine-protein kinase
MMAEVPEVPEALHGAAAEASRVGQVVGGRYQIVGLLGQGGMGVVYEARHTLVGRRFAIKFLRPEHARDLEMLARFQREARAAGALESENIAAVTDFGLDEAGTPYLVMERLAGDDLARLLERNGRLAATRAAGIALQACRGLAVAHAAGIVHRDLKPENLFVLRRADGGDLVKVIDFGIAKLRAPGGDASGTTANGAEMGTPYYMPPEQARGERDLDHRVDVYAMGAILYEMLAGAKAHRGDGYNAILFDILDRPPTPLAPLRPGLPAGLAAVVERAMAFEPADRHASAAELADALAPFAGGARLPGEAARATAIVARAAGSAAPVPVADPRAFTVRAPATVEVTAARDGDAGGAPGARTRGRRRLLPLAVAAAALLVAAGAVVRARQGRFAVPAGHAAIARPAPPAAQVAPAATAPPAPEPAHPPEPPPRPAPEPAVAAPPPAQAPRRTPATPRRPRHAAAPAKPPAGPAPAATPAAAAPGIDIDSRNPYDGE